MTRELCIMACVFCRDLQFRVWLSQREGQGRPFSEHEAKHVIMAACQIGSRNELDTNPEAAQRFHDQIRTPYLEWREQQ